MERREPNFLCRPLVSREAVQAAETDELVGKLFDGSVDKLFAALVGRRRLSAEQLERLREIVGERVPGIDGEVQENFLQLNRELDGYLARIKGEPGREEEESAAFFAREDLQKALRSPRFIEKELLTYSKWRRDETGSGLLRRILEFYQEHPDISGADRVVEEVGKDLDRRAVKLRDQGGRSGLL